MSEHTAHLPPFTHDFLHQRRSPEEADRIERHCQACPDCARALDLARRRLALLRAVPPSEPSDGLVEATLGRIDGKQTSRPLRRSILLGALGAVAACVL